MTFNPNKYVWITPKAEDLWKITITAGDPFDDHQEILIEPAAVVGDSMAPVPYPELLAACRYLTGIMARAAMILREEHEELTRDHRCSRNRNHWCDIAFKDADLAETDEGWGPYVSISVPTKQGKVWLRKVRATVAAVLAADAKQPTAAQIAAHAGDDADAQQQRAETFIRSLDDQPQPSTTRKESTQP